MKTAIIGSRYFTDYDYFLQIINAHPVPITEIISGGAKGTDKLAEKYAKENNIPVSIIYPDYRVYGKRAPQKRNIEIIENCEQVIVFWDGLCKGTSFTMKEARERDLAVFLFYAPSSRIDLLTN
jgi:predicted Rossmann fold nucleotide-binding protein DprA/Smf involved in DNA uptake